LRGYGAISPQFWTGKTGKQLRNSKDARILATHLITGSNANMLGLYYLPIPLIIHETGLTAKEVSTAFKFLKEEGFAYYHEETEFVYIPAMAPWQMGDLKPNDNKVKGVNREYAALPDNPFLGEFFDRHHEGLYLENRREWKGSGRAPEGLGKGLPRASEGLGEGSEGLGKDYGPGPAPGHDPGLGSGLEKKQEDLSLRGRRFSDDPQNLVDLWNEKAPEGHNRVHTVSDGMRALIKAAYKQLPERRDWEEILQEIELSDFLCGQKWVSFDWVIKISKSKGETVENFIKIKNGNYRNDGRSGLSRTTQHNLEVMKRFVARGEQQALTEANSYGSDGSDGVRKEPLALSGGEGGEGERSSGGDLLSGLGGVFSGASSGGDDVGEAEYQSIPEHPGAEDVY
jgi:hypothetical protein